MDSTFIVSKPGKMLPGKMLVNSFKELIKRL